MRTARTWRLETAQYCRSSGGASFSMSQSISIDAIGDAPTGRPWLLLARIQIIALRGNRLDPEICFSFPPC